MMEEMISMVVNEKLSRYFDDSLVRFSLDGWWRRNISSRWPVETTIRIRNFICIESYCICNNRNQERDEQERPIFIFKFSSRNFKSMARLLKWSNFLYFPSEDVSHRHCVIEFKSSPRGRWSDGDD